MSWICPKCETQNHVQCEVCNEPIFNARKENDSGQTFADVQSHLPPKYKQLITQYLNDTLGTRILEETIGMLREEDISIYKEVLREAGAHLSYQYANTVIADYQNKLDKIVYDFCAKSQKQINEETNPNKGHREENEKKFDRNSIPYLCDLFVDKGLEISRIERLIKLCEDDLRTMVLSKENIAVRNARIIALKKEKEVLEINEKRILHEIGILEADKRKKP